MHTASILPLYRTGRQLTQPITLADSRGPHRPALCPMNQFSPCSRVLSARDAFVTALDAQHQAHHSIPHPCAELVLERPCNMTTTFVAFTSG